MTTIARALSDESEKTSIALFGQETPTYEIIERPNVLFGFSVYTVQY